MALFLSIKDKILKCKNLVSIFESEWISKCSNIKKYLVDLFNGVENNLSFVDGSKCVMNNNYPVPGFNYIPNYTEVTYKFRAYIIYTCGFTKLV